MPGNQEKIAGDGVPRQEGFYRIEWLKGEDLPQVARLEAEFFPEPLDLESLLRLWAMPVTCYLAVKRRPAGRLHRFSDFRPDGAPLAWAFTGAPPGGLAHNPENRRPGGRQPGSAAVLAGKCGSQYSQLKFLLEKLGWMKIGVCPRF